MFDQIGMAELIYGGVGLILSILFGLLSNIILNRIAKDIEVPPPIFVNKEDWENVISRKGTEAGVWLGFFESILFYISIILKIPELIFGWFAFKVASKWEIWANVVKVPEKIENEIKNDLDYLRARHAWGSRLLQRFLLGTMMNLIAAFIGALIALIMFTYCNTPYR